MTELIESAGVFIYPLGLCSVLAIFVMFERIVALRSSKVIPDQLVQSLLDGKLDEIPEDSSSSLGRIVSFAKQGSPDSESLKAFAQLEITRLERGMFLLEVVVGAAPLLGLLGTVWGLRKVFASITPESGMPEMGMFIGGVALALSTTMLGMLIAIPAIVGNGYLGRRVEVLATKIDLVVERIRELNTVCDEKT